MICSQRATGANQFFPQIPCPTTRHIEDDSVSYLIQASEYWGNRAPSPRHHSAEKAKTFVFGGNLEADSSLRKRNTLWPEEKRHGRMAALANAMIVMTMMMLATSLARPAILAGQLAEENWIRCESHDPEQSIAGCSALIQAIQNPNTKLADAFYNRGRAYASKHDYGRAIKDYDQAIRLNPTLGNAFYSRGLAYRHKGDYDRAIEDYNQALRINPKYVEAFYGRGLAYQQKAEYDHAIEDFDQVLRINPSYADAFISLGNVYAQKGEYDRGIANFDQAVSLNPLSADAFYNRGRAYEYIGDYTRAIPDYDEALRLKPGDADALYGRGLAYRHLGEYDRALHDYDQALRIKPSLGDAFRDRSLVRVHKGNYLRAIADYGHWMWVKFGILGVTIRLCILSFAIMSVYRFRRATHIKTPAPSVE
jgi:tetratricopeptide (TPR) repeat protein